MIVVYWVNEKQMKEKIKKFCKNINLSSIWDMVSITIKQLGITFLPVIIAVIILALLGDKMKDIMYRNDILGGSIITAVCVSLQVIGKRRGKESIISLFSKAYVLIGCICYIVLTVSDKFINKEHIQYNWIEVAMYIGIGLSIILVLLSNYDVHKAEIQKKADEGRNLKEGQIGNINLKLGE